MDHKLPSYAARLDAMHSALVDDFRRLVQRIPLSHSATALDAGCGDGFYTELLAERLPGGCAIALDNSPSYLEAARGRLGPRIAAGRARVVEGDVTALPFDDGSLDAVWSGHSMQSYDSLPEVMAEFYRVLRPGGVLAVLETDNLHSIMLPWPPSLELAVKQAERRLMGSVDDRMGAYFPRYATGLFRGAGFEGLHKHHELIHRTGPLRGPIHAYVQLYLDDIAERTAEPLTEEQQRAVAEFARIFAQPSEDMYFSSLQVLMTARRPGDASGSA
ncbi:MAG TPA: class I SAM-dependent methyltransferase [Lacipirellulaceae bacterium]|nr:class I SAM-dependent methyltransferase [Lacipirellulaceae bacterium]